MHSASDAASTLVREVLYEAAVDPNMADTAPSPASPAFRPKSSRTGHAGELISRPIAAAPKLANDLLLKSSFCRTGWSGLPV